MRHLLLTLALLALLGPATAAAANSTVDGYTVSMDLRPTSLSAGERATVTFTIWDRNMTPVRNEGIFVSITSDGTDQFASDRLRTSRQGRIELDYRFNNPGDYSFQVGFKPQNKFLSTSFGTEVTGIHTRRRATDSLLIVIAIAALTAGYMIGLAREFRNPDL